MKLISNRFLKLSLLVSVFAVMSFLGGCSDGDGPLDPTDSIVPSVSMTAPENISIGVPLNSKVTATFSEEMDVSTITTETFKVTGPATTPVAGTVTYVGTIATFTPASNLADNTLFTATITTGAKDLAGNALAADFVWEFTTGSAEDIIAPTVTSVIPIDDAIEVSINSKVSATFSEGMDVSTITAETFKVTGPTTTPVAGTVTCSGTTAIFTPSSNLADSTLFTATITTGVKDLAGNALAANFVWIFSTSATADTAPPTVTSVAPFEDADGVLVNSKVTATFSEEMDISTITAETFKVTGPATTPVAGTLTYSDTTAVFTPASTLADNTLFTATVTTVAKDLAGNALAVDYVWTFTTGFSLGESEHFGGFGSGAGITNDGIYTVINGDIGTTGASTLITGFHDSGGNVYSETALNIGTVNGTIYTATAPPGSEPGVIATACFLNAQKAYINLSPAALPGGIDVSTLGGGAGELGSRVLAPGVYKSAPGSYDISLGDLTLDGQGDSDALWVFQMESSLTVGIAGPDGARSVILINGAQAKNIYWQVGSSATINGAGGGTMEGTIIASAGVSFSTVDNVELTTLNGRAIGLNASVTMVNTIINIPAP